jgi:conjugative relaxase-like TrwC/TraI family protein
MAWFRPMGVNEVAYHQATVVGRADDHPGAALDYYGSRGETPLRWAGSGASRLGLVGEVTEAAYKAAFGPGGFRDPGSGTRLVASTRPGFELVVSAHKSVALLGVIGHADAMHSILDVETGATIGWLNDWFQERGGRRGREQIRTATGGLSYAVTRHATSRAGDPSPHDHVLVANVVEMLDDRGGFKALDSAALRDSAEAATMVGRLHAAWRAVQLGYQIEPDDGPSGNLRHWRLTAIPGDVCEVFSKRSDEIDEHLAANGQHGYRARAVAARATRSVKRHTGVDQLMPQWRAELDDIGWSADRLSSRLSATRVPEARMLARLTDEQLDRMAAEVLGVDGRLLAQHKVFTRTHLVADLAPRLYGHDPAELDQALDHLLASRDIVPLIGLRGVREQSYTTAEVLAAERTIAVTVEALAERAGPEVSPALVEAALAAQEDALGHRLTDGQRAVVEHLCTSGKGVALVVGAAGSGKTTALDAATAALHAAGYEVVGTATSGQAARTLQTEAGVPARTLASLRWGLDHGTIRLDERTVVVVDETSMVDDANLAPLLLAVRHTGASVMLIGDPHQLDAVGPGGALRSLLEVHPDLTVTLDGNVRQRDPDEREALLMLRHGYVAAAVNWYANTDRLLHQSTRLDTLVAMSEAWAADIAAGHDTAILAWRRADVADLNRLARDHWDRLGHLSGPDVEIDRRAYAVGDRIVALAPNPTRGIVTSEQLTVTAVGPGSIRARTDDERDVVLTGEGADRDHIDHAYAITVHRAQGATYDRAHVLADGGGRELGYVAVSRARDRTTIHITADTRDQAVDHLRSDWLAETHQTWITAIAAQSQIPALDRGEVVQETADAGHRFDADRAARDVGVRGSADLLGALDRSAAAIELPAIDDDIGLGL